MEINDGITIIVALLLICAGCFLGYAMDDPEKEIVYVDKIVIQEKLVEINSSDSDYSLTKSEYEDDADEAKALELANDELSSRDLKKAIYNALENSSVDIENYKDIYEIKVMDSDVDGNEVEYDLKVYYYLDGDEDETEKARLNEFTVTVNDLDYDDNYSDSEVDESYLDSISVSKVYK